MAHKSAALFLSLNLMFFIMVTPSARANYSPSYSKSTPTHSPSPSPSPSPSSSSHTPSTKTNSTKSSVAKCSMDTLKLGVCVNVLNGLVNATIGTPATQPCCHVVKGLLDLEAAACLCMSIKASLFFGMVNVDIPLKFKLLLDGCARNKTTGFECVA